MASKQELKEQIMAVRAIAEETLEKAVARVVKDLEKVVAERRDRLAKVSTTATYAAGLRSQAAAVSRAPGSDFEARHLRVSAGMAEADTKPFTSGVAPKTPPGKSSAAQYAEQLRRAAAGAEAAKNPIEARWLRASAAQAEKGAASYATMTKAMSAPPKRVTSDEWMGREAVSPEVARKKVDQANADLQAAILAGESPSVLARLRTALAAAQLAESYALNGVRSTPSN
jgi:hypothetical protein